MQKFKSIRKYFALIGALTVAAGLKIWLSVSESVPLNGDEAVVSLMARHILQGARPTFFYGQAYMGSLDAWLVAIGFRLFGEGVMAVRIVQSFLYLIYLITIWALTRKFYRDKLTANFAVLIAAIPPVLVTTYTTATLGGYGESLILGNLILLIGYNVTFGDRKEDWRAWLFLGLAGGLAFWVLGISGIYLLPIGLVGLWQFSIKKIRYYAIAGMAFFAGGSAWWLYNLQHSWEAFAALAGPDPTIQINFIERFIGFLFLGITTLFGVRMPWTPTFIPWPLLIIAITMYLALGLYKLRIAKGSIVLNPGAAKLLILFVAVFLVVFNISRFGVDVSGRYFLPMYLVLLMLMAEFATFAWHNKRIFGIGIVVINLLFNGAATWLAATSSDKITTQLDPITNFDNSHDDELMTFLRDNGEIRGYSNYWVSFRIAFLSGEKIIFSADIPDKLDLSLTSKYNRYPLYADLVDASEKVAYITTKHPILNADLRAKFDALGVTYLEEQIGDFHIFYSLSRTVRPEELGYGGVSQ